MATTRTLELTDDRRSRLLREFRAAFGATPREAIVSWGKQSGAILADVTVRRGRNVGSQAGRFGNFVLEESRALLDAVRQRVWGQHLLNRTRVGAHRALEFGAAFHGFYVTLREKVLNNPREAAPQLAAGVLGFYLGSGGPDGDGGVPDLDLLGGIGAHRSILTHSILSGIVVESLVLSFLALSKTVYGNLPQEHDPLWEDLNNAGEKFLTTFTTGVSMGIAYHLGVDATLDGSGTYKDLPFDVPQVGHQAILAANAVVEATDAVERVGRANPPERCEFIFETYREAADFAKQRPGRVIRRVTGGKGFRVEEKVRHVRSSR